MACAGCHKLGTVGVGVTGPDLNQLPQVAGTRVPGEDAETYVYNSIVTPSAHVTEGFPDNVMPHDFPDRMSDEQIRSLVTWLLVPLPSGSASTARRTAWSAALGFFAAVPIAYLVMVAAVQIVRPLFG